MMYKMQSLSARLVTLSLALALLVATLLQGGVDAQGTAGVPSAQNAGTGAPVATFPTGLGGSGTTAVFTPGAAQSNAPSTYFVATNAEESASLASLLTHYSQGITAATPTTGPPAGISTGIPGGFTGENTSSVLDGQVTTIPNAATTYTGPRSTSTGGSNAAAAQNAAINLTPANSKSLAVSAVALSIAMLVGAFIL